MKIFYMLAALTIVGLLSSSCGGSREVVVERVDPQPRQESKSERMNQLLLKSAMAADANRDMDYKIGADDLLEIDVFQADELKSIVRVSRQGYIGIPLLGQIRAKGLSPVELEKEIAQRLDKYMQEPRVSVSVKEYKAQKIAVIGAVTTPQVYSVTGQRYLLDMLTVAGGLAKDAGNLCYILRSADTEKTDASKPDTIVINLDELFEKGDFSLNLPVFGGDVINVAKAGSIFVDGPVNRPGAIPFQPKISLRQAIIMAGGLRYEAKPSEVKLLRDNGDGTREVMTVNYEDISEGRSDDVPIRENDIIVVGTDGFKNFLTTFFGFVRGGYSTGGVVLGH